MVVPAKRKKSSFFTVALVFFILCLVSLQLLRMREKLAIAEEERTALSERVARQEQENRSLEAALERAEDVQYLQSLAREQLGMVSPGQKDFYDVSN